MRIGIQFEHSGDFAAAVDRLVEFEKAGVDSVSVPEAYSFDAVSQLGYLAARTTSAELSSGILQLYARTPALTAATAAGLDMVSGGRFALGVGASGPQVVEGFHGVPYDAPLGRTRELVEICRQVWRREPLVHEGTHFRIPLPADRGTGLGKPLKLIDHPVRPRIPITIAAIGPRNVALAAEVAEGWEPIFFHPERAERAWGAALAEGRSKRDPRLGPLQIAVWAPLAVTDDPGPVRDLHRPVLARYIGGMGSRGRNFYNDLAARFGYEDAAREIQDLFLNGRRDAATAAVPDDLVDAVSLIGSAGHLAERIAALAAAGVTTVRVKPMARGHRARLADVEVLRGLT
ncbi:LLM class F420-dependent oxidoreductase [Pseudonocardia halophobica]|uniref:LLM class F420-dependent oxidoreductase n=1 Tax=Pseudonocardia halophobica TaxID=29401 RepID=A0A9W6L071_9PSEU|nr:LLM class F420-dependent oxidoreductase [Pseudonocardia halophobica]GLL09859.1 LLM class F420-dependent oxidoreductase [Pseudonocardia halophobica]